MASPKSLEAFHTLNKIRSEPLTLESEINDQMSKFDADGQTIRDNGIIIATKEGIQAWQEAYNALNEQQRLEKLLWSDELALAAYDVCREIQGMGLTGSYS